LKTTEENDVQALLFNPQYVASLSEESSSSDLREKMEADPYFNSILALDEDPLYKSSDDQQSQSPSVHRVDGEKKITINQVKDAIYHIQTRFFFDIKPYFVYDNMLTNLLKLINW
jgi:hypothetical protein